MQAHLFSSVCDTNTWTPEVKHVNKLVKYVYTKIANEGVKICLFKPQM